MRRMANTPMVCNTTVPTIIRIPRGSWIINAMCSGAMAVSIAARVGARKASTQPVIRPWALTVQDLPFDLEPLSNKCREIVEDLGKVASRLTLRQHGGRKEPGVEQRHTVAEIVQGLGQRHPVVLPIVNQAKLRADRTWYLVRRHAQSRSEGVTRTKGPGNQVQSLRKLLLELPQTAARLVPHEQERCSRRDHPGQEGDCGQTGQEVGCGAGDAREEQRREEHHADRHLETGALNLAANGADDEIRP